jgi:hypothetical protein
MRGAARALLVLLTQTWPAAVLVGQQTDATVTGTVRSKSGEPIPDATVTLRDESTGFRSQLRSDPAGRFSFFQVPLGGPYSLTAQRVGFRPVERSGYVLVFGSRVSAALAMEEAPVTLEQVPVSADSARARAQTVGGNYRVGAIQMAAIPASNRNFTDLASLAPTTGSQQSLGGQRWTSTDFRLDGAQARNMLRAGEYGAGPFTVSMEAIREFEVSSNVYDVGQGRQNGGAIRAATKTGTNEFTGSAFAYYKSATLSASTDFQGRGRVVRDFQAIQWGASIGGPIVRDRLHFFLAFDRQNTDTALFTGYIRTPQDEIANGVSADSLNRMMSILGTLYGTDTTRTQLGRLNRSPVANSVFARLDWELSPEHHVTLRDDYTDWNSPLSGGVDQPIALWEARSDFASRENQALASLRSILGAETQNELRLVFSTSRRALTPVSDVPRGFVRIRSTLPDGTTGDVKVQFGGNRLAPDDSREEQLQLIDQVFLQRGPVLFTFGTDNTLTWLTTYVAESQSGLYEFDDLSSLDAEHASRYSRSVALATTPTTHQSVGEIGLFGQADWRPSNRLTLTGGLRWDGTAFLTAPEYNAVVERTLGIRTDRNPSDWTKIQPRVQVLWDTHGDGRELVRVGAGRFASQLPYYEEHNQLLNDGLQLVDVVYTGASVPAPDYPEYRTDPSTIPGVPSGGPLPPSYVNSVTTGFRTPSTWRGSAAYQRRVVSWLSLGATVLASRTTGNYQYFDRNMRTTPAFTLDNEGNRPVFVPASTINVRGQTLNQYAWITDSVGRVLELTPAGTAENVAAIAEVQATLPHGALLNLSYTYNRSRDNSTFGCCLGRTASTFTAITGDPRDLSGSWGPSDLDFRDKVVAAGVSPAWHGFRLSARYVGMTGRPFSAVVNGDINGDEANGNDLAFVFDPDDPETTPAVAASMRKVLANPDNVARDYLLKNLGKVASRNGATVPYSGRVDVRFAKAIDTFRGQHLELSVDCFNFLNLLNRDWGSQLLLPVGISTQNPVNQRVPLLNVVGFDQATQRYIYTVNENFGVLQRGGDPYQLQLGIRYAF